MAVQTVVDDQTGIKTVSTYSQDWGNHFQGLLTMGRTLAPDLTVLNEETHTWDVEFFTSVAGEPPYCFRFSPHMETAKRDLNGALISTVEEDTEFDAFGNPTLVATVTEDTYGTYTKTTTNTYTNDTTKWHLGRLTEATVTHERDDTGGSPTTADITRTSEFTCDPTTGILTPETGEPGDTLFSKKTARSAGFSGPHNAFGGVTSVTETWGPTSTDGISGHFTRVTVTPL